MLNISEFVKEKDNKNVKNTSNINYNNPLPGSLRQYSYYTIHITGVVSKCGIR